MIIACSIATLGIKATLGANVKHKISEQNGEIILPSLVGHREQLSFVGHHGLKSYDSS